MIDLVSTIDIRLQEFGNKAMFTLNQIQKFF